MMYTKSVMNASDLEKKAALVRKWCLISTTEAASGHATSALSAADIGAVLFDKYFTFDLKNKQNLYNDRLIFSKGHASPLLYSLYAAAGAYPFEELKTLRQFGSMFEGHPVPAFPYTEAATGSLGQGLSIGAGMALGLQKIEEIKPKPKVFVLLGDGEMAEGSIWEAADFASYYKLNNLIAIVDVNRFGQSQETMFGHNLFSYRDRLSAFGWETMLIDGHNYGEIDNALKAGVGNRTQKPFAIIAKTLKGKGIPQWENKNGFHSKPVSKDDLPKILEDLGNPKDEVIFSLPKPKKIFQLIQSAQSIDVSLSHNEDEKLMTKEVYGKALVEVAKKIDTVISLDGDVKNSTSSQDFEAVFPDKAIECFIAEQNMIGVGIGLGKIGFMPFISTFSAFFTRAFDQIRMGRVSEATIKLIGSYAGVSLGKDGSSQMGLEDMAMIGALPDSVILYPADAIATEKLVGVMPSITGISYMRLSRPKVPIIYKDTDMFSLGGSKILRQSEEDLLTIVAAGITVHEALKAYEELKKEKIFVRVVDCYCIKPIDNDTLIECSRTTQQNAIITVEDHFVHGGLGDFVMEAVAGTGACVTKMAVMHISHSGTEEEVLDDAGISAKHIIAKVKQLV